MLYPWGLLAQVSRQRVKQLWRAISIVEFSVNPLAAYFRLKDKNQ